MAYKTRHIRKRDYIYLLSLIFSKIQDTTSFIMTKQHRVKPAEKETVFFTVLT